MTAGRRRPGSVPTATYRLQLTERFTLDDAVDVLPVIAKLGVSHLYLSPLLASARGSDHGYDVVDHSRIDVARGGEDGLRRLSAAAHRHGLGLILDIVPNHVSVAVPSDNLWWWDVLRLGRDSPFESSFDIDWGTGRIVLPALEHAGDLARLRLARHSGGTELRLDEQRFPAAPGSEDIDAGAVHDRQSYRLVDWRRGSSELNYRRFLDVTTLAAIRVEDEEVFSRSHALVLRLLDDGLIDGLRIDHPDGLAAPADYLARLDRATGGVWTVVEKILAADEPLPPWSVDGTTGYDAARLVTGVFIDPDGAAALTEHFQAFTDQLGDFPTIALDGKRKAATGLLAAETARLARLAAIPDAFPALVELLARLPVYRTYLPHGNSAALDAGAAEAATNHPKLATAIAALLPRLRDGADPLCLRFQQTSAAVMAKGVEDTAFYRYHALLALNEVGGDPSRFGVNLPEWHREATRLQTDWPNTMTALSTHDTKRSEDVRARLVLLSEAPTRWIEAVARLSAASAPHLGRVARDDEYLLHQTLFGAGLIDPERLGPYMSKAAREAKQHTSWQDPQEDYDRDLQALTRAVLADRTYVSLMAALHAGFAAAWQRTLLAQKLLQLTMPGVPDVYQGSERQLTCLVDPDNRRAVDYAPLAGPDEPKTRLCRTVLWLRRDRPAYFSGYQPLDTGSRYALAFARSEDLVVVVARLAVGLDEEGFDDAEVTLPSGSWSDVLTGRQIGSPRLADLIGMGPGAVLVRDSARTSAA